jgi:RNA polymerase sigma-70 factor (ECF subfamily)
VEIRLPDKYTSNNDMLQAIMPIKDKLYRYALRILGNQMAAEDVVQEVFIKVWKKREEVEDIENKEAWCMTVTRNLALDKLRKKKYRHESVEDHYSLQDGAMNPAEQIQSNDIMKQIRQAIDELPDDQRQVVHLRDVEGYKYKEIADITGLTIEKVKVYLHRARIVLRKQLANIER